MAKLKDFAQNPINVAYDAYAKEPSEQNLGSLLSRCQKRTYQRFARVEGADTAEEVAALTMMKLYRALPGYNGDDPLRPFDPAKGEFAAYAATVAQHVLLDFLKMQGRRREVQWDEAFPIGEDGERIYEPSVEQL